MKKNLLLIWTFIFATGSPLLLHSKESGSNEKGISTNIPSSPTDYLKSFSISNRPQQVRLFLNGNTDLIDKGEGAERIMADPMKEAPVSFAFLKGKTASLIGSPFGNVDSQASLIVQPSLFLCYADTLKTLKKIGLNPNIIDKFDKFRIDEVNLFLQPAVFSLSVPAEQVSTLIENKKALTQDLQKLKAESDEIGGLNSGHIGKLNARNAALARIIDLGKREEKPAALEEMFKINRPKIDAYYIRLDQVNSEISRIRTSLAELRSKLDILQSATQPRLLLGEIKYGSHSLNILIPYFTNLDKCKSPTDKELERLFSTL